VDTVRALLEAGADKTLKDEKGKTPLQMACTGGNKHNKAAIVALLEVSRVRRRRRRRKGLHRAVTFLLL